MKSLLVRFEDHAFEEMLKRKLKADVSWEHFIFDCIMKDEKMQNMRE